MIARNLPVRQIAYFVPDIREAALRHHRLFGSGPYFVADHIPLQNCRYRGAPASLDHSSAYGQWGGVMIEFVQQNNPGPSPFHDMYLEETGTSGLHHIALFADDLGAEIARFEAAGFPNAFYGEMLDGFAFAMMDAVASHGHMIELYEPVPALTGFYAMVAETAQGWDGHEVIRTSGAGD